MNGKIYIVTNNVTGKQYVGQTVTNDRKGHGLLIKKSYKKYGLENFDYDIIIDNIDDPDELNGLEIKYIAEKNTLYPNGYNLERGGYKCKVPWNKGKTGVYTEETIIKMSESTKGQVAWNKGKTGVYTEESLLKMSKARKGISPVNKGVSASEERKRKQSLAMKGKTSWNKGKTGIYSEETRNKMSQSTTNRLLKDNPMSSEQSRKKVSQSKIGLKRLTKDGINKMAKPNTEKWETLIEQGFIPST